MCKSLERKGHETSRELKTTTWTTTICYGESSRLRGCARGGNTWRGEASCNRSFKGLGAILGAGKQGVINEFKGGSVISLSFA